MQKIIWLSDLHFDPQSLVQGHDSGARLTAAIDLINAQHADAACCVITGDMVETASDESYSTLAERLASLKIPVLPMTGNHDDRAMLSAHLTYPNASSDGFVHYAVGLEDHVLICLDTLDQGNDSGLLCAERLAWFRHALTAAGDTPVSIFMHHPPLKLGLSMLDPDNLSNSDAFWRMVEDFPTVRSVFAGHVHRATMSSHKGITVNTLPAVIYQAPPEHPSWDWNNFSPAREAPKLGVIHFDQDQTTVHLDEICPFEIGGPAS